MSSLIVLLPAEPVGASSEFPYLLTGDPRAPQSHGSAPAALLPRPQGAAAEVVAVVPAQALSWHRVELPKGVAAGSPKLRGVLEGLLEEQLLDDPEALHFALGPPAAGEPQWVAVCERAWLRGALQALEAAGRTVNRIVPEFAPEGMGTLYAVGETQQPWVVAAGADGVLMLPLAAASLSLLPAWAQDAPRLAEPAVAAQAEQLLQHQVELQQAPQRWLQATQSGWDLAQFEFANTARTRTLKKLAAAAADLLRAPRWKPARWGLVLLVLANLAGLNAWAWKERSALDARREAIRRTLTETFPTVTVVVDAPLQMQRELDALRARTGTSSGRDLESMLAALSVAAPPGRTVSSLEFSGDRLRARGMGLTPDTVRTAAINLRSYGYGATLEGDALVIAPEAAP
ncbi:MAG: type II secretion system protein GspL [Pseudomonadota bacterium]